MKSKSIKFNEYAWKMLLSFSLVYLFFYNGRQNINLVMTQMADDFGVSTSAIGIISSSLFWCYAFGQLINGRLGQYLGYKKTMIIGIIMSVIMNILISYQNSILVIAILWGLNGFFQSMVWANGIGVLNRWWPKEKRGFATGFATAFSGLAQVVTYLSVSLCISLMPNLSWRAGFRFPIIPILFLLIPFYFLFKENPEDVNLMPLNERKVKNIKNNKKNNNLDINNENIKSENFFLPYKKLFCNAKMILFCIISSIAGIGRYGLLTWIPTYFTEVMGLPIKEGIFASILLPIGQAFAMFVFPFITDKLFKGKREPMLALASILTFITVIIFPFVNSKILASIFLFIVGIFSMVTGIIWAVAGDIGGSKYSSIAAGILDWAVYMGAAIQAFIFGLLKDIFGWNIIFITIGCLYVLILILTFLASKIKEVENESYNF